MAENKGLGAIGGLIGLVFVAFWTLGWSAGTLSFDGKILSDLYRQVRSTGYRSVPGKILAAELEEHSDSEDGTTYAPRLRYSYKVHDSEFNGTRYRFGPMTHSQTGVLEILDENRVGKEISVFCDPSAPGTSVLHNALQGRDLFPLIFLTPFNLIMIGTWWFVGSGIWFHFHPQKHGGITIRTDIHSVIARFGEPSPFLRVGGFLMASTFALVFLLGFPFKGNPPIWVMIVVFLLLAIAAAIVFLRTAAQRDSGKYDLILDTSQRWISFPSPWGDLHRESVAFESIREVSVRVKVIPDSEGETRQYEPLITWETAHGQRKESVFAAFTTEECANGFLEWLKSHLFAQDGIPSLSGTFIRRGSLGRSPEPRNSGKDQHVDSPPSCMVREDMIEVHPPPRGS